MFAVIQEIQTKKEFLSNTYERIEVFRTVGDGGPSFYSYRNTGERFKRPIKKAYKISIHHSYRKNGKVKKKQWVIGTHSYYDLIDYGFELSPWMHKEKMAEMDITADELEEMIWKKLEPIIEKIMAEYEQTREYKAEQEQRAILEQYREVSYEFEKLYGKGTYNRCYDIFGNLMNEEYLNKLIADKKASEEYERKSREHQERAYEDFSKKYSSGGSYSNPSPSNYTDEEKKLLKRFYKVLALEFHPDTKRGSEAAMKLANKLKEEWDL